MADSNNHPHSPRSSPRVPRHATQMLPEELTPERKTAVKVPPHATQVLPDVLLHAKEEIHSPVSPETNFVNFEKHLLANHLGSLGDCMIYQKHPHPIVGDDDDNDNSDTEQVHSQTTPHTGPRAKLDKESMKNQSGSFGMVGECFYTDH